MTDIEGNSKIMVKCYCTIVANKSISYYMDVVEKEAFDRYKDMLQEEISKLCGNKAPGVPLITPEEIKLLNIFEAIVKNYLHKKRGLIKSSFLFLC